LRPQRIVEDISALPTYAWGPRMTMWWGTLGFCALEGMGFALAIGAYLYLVQVNPQWPLADLAPNHWPGTLVLVILLASIWPNFLAERHAREENRRAVQRDLVIMSAIGAVLVAIRLYEFTQLNVRWDQNAYGSATWLLLGLHATHIITDLGDTLVLTALMFTRHAHGKRFSDVEDNAFYWYFVVATWVPIYLLIYWVPRW
jgi:heme/copper-type cytochrome/quinol oxidase subunit 3